MKWYLEDVRGWKRPTIEYDPARLLGTAVHAGLAAMWRSNDPALAIHIAFELEWPQEGAGTHSREGLEELCLKGVNVAWKALSGLQAAPVEPLMVEVPLGADGHTVPDLVCMEGERLVITDYKISWRVTPEQMPYRLEGTERTHQFWHYAWGVGQRFGKPVDEFRKLVIALTPTVRVRADSFAPTKEGLEEWLRGARSKWLHMHDIREGVVGPYRREEGCKPYGEKYPCEMWSACWDCHGDEKKMLNFFTRKEPA